MIAVTSGPLDAPAAELKRRVRPALREAYNFPPWFSTIERQIDSPITIPLGLVVKKAEKLSNRDANLAIARKRFGRNRLRCWSALRLMLVSGVQSLNFVCRTPTRAKLIAGGPPPPPALSVDRGDALSPGAFVVAQVVGPMARCHRPIFCRSRVPRAGPGAALGPRGTGRRRAHCHNDAPVLLVALGSFVLPQAL
jgi:hypothetical protein